MGAVFSPCGSYRYALWRTLQRQDPPRVSEQGGTALFVMLNPSTADAIEDDPTIRRCLAFVRREGLARLAVANLYALRSTDPALLGRHPDPVGPLNDEWILELASSADLIVAAWGASRHATVERAEHVARVLRAASEIHCLGLTADGHPGHPLYLPADRPLVGFPQGVLIG